MTRKIVICGVCGEEKINYGHGMCQTCWWKQYKKDNYEKIRLKDKRYRESQPDYGSIKTNINCSSYLGYHIAEQVLSKIFKNVERMPYGHSGYDFICGRGYKVDVKSACLNKENRWQFKLRYNTITDYFLCIAFDNREDLNPKYLWLMPGSDMNDHSSICISQSTINKWSKYELDKLNDVITCCNVMKDYND